MSKIDRKKYLRQRSTNKAEQILLGALPEFLQHGYASTSMDRIASSAGVSKQTLYSYFSDKDGLFTSLIQHIASQKFQLVWSQPLQGEPKQVLQDLAQRMLQEVNDEEYLNFVRLVVAESGKRPELSQLFLKNLAKPAHKLLTRYFQEHDELNLADPETTAMIFIGSLIFLMISQEVLHGKEIMPMKSDRYVDNLIQLVLNQSC